jgi:hypothetical protein
MTNQRLAGGGKGDNFFITNRHWISNSFLFKRMLGGTIIMCIPCALLTATNKEIPTLFGDECDRSWGDLVLGVYVALYVFIFIGFAISLRAIDDGFKIKAELKVTGAIGICAVIPWVIFNNQLEDVNNEVFPFSTLFLIIAVGAALSASTVWPLYRSIFQPPALQVNVSDDCDVDITTLKGIVSSILGHKSFEAFLTKEFSVENLLFYKEVETFQELCADETSDDGEVDSQAQYLYDKYIVENSPFQVNLPATTIKKLRAAMLSKDLRGFKDNADGDAKAYTLFDPSSRNIYNLMEKDSLPRYKRSAGFKRLVEALNDVNARAQLMADLGAE